MRFNWSGLRLGLGTFNFWTNNFINLLNHAKFCVYYLFNYLSSIVFYGMSYAAQSYYEKIYLKLSLYSLDPIESQFTYSE